MNKNLKPHRQLQWGMFGAGMLWGILLMFTFAAVWLRANLITETPCTADFDTSRQKLIQSFRGTDWELNAVGCPLPITSDSERTLLYRLCHPRYGATLLATPKTRRISALIPCQISLFERDGKTFLARLNIRLLGYLIGEPTLSLFNDTIAPEQDELLFPLLNR